MGVPLHTHTRISYRLGVGPFKRVPARMLPRHFAHSFVLVQRVAYLRGIRMEVRPSFQYSLKRCVQGPKPVLKKPFIHFADRATALPELRTTATSGVRTG